MHINGERYNFEHIIHLIREIDHLKTEIQPHDTGHIHTTISTLERRVKDLMQKHENSSASLKYETGSDGSFIIKIDEDGSFVTYS